MDNIMKSDKFKHLKQIIRPPSNANSDKTQRTRVSKTLNYAAPAKHEVITNSSINVKINQPPVNASLRQRRLVKNGGNYSQISTKPNVSRNVFPPLQETDLTSADCNASQILGAGSIASVRQGLEPNISRTTLGFSDGKPLRNTFMKDNSGFLIPQRTNSFKQSFRPNYSEKLEKEYLDEVMSLVNEFKEVEYEYIIDKCHSYATNLIKKKQMANHRNEKTELNSWLNTNQNGNCAVGNTGELMNYQSFHDSSRFNLNPTTNPINNNYPPQNMRELLAETLKHNYRDKLMCILKDWTVLRNENSDLFLSGTLLDMLTEEILEERHITSKMIKRINSNVVGTQLCIYVLQGKFQDSNSAMPKEIKSVFKNDGFPEMWQSLAEHWGEIIKSQLPRSTSHLFNIDNNFKTRGKVYRQQNGEESYSCVDDTNSSTGDDRFHEAISYEVIETRNLHKRKNELDDSLGNQNKRQKGSQHSERGSQRSRADYKKGNKTSSNQMIQNFTMQLRSHSKSRDYSTKTRITNKRRILHLETQNANRKFLNESTTRKNCLCTMCSPKRKKISFIRQTPGPRKMSRRVDSLIGSDSD